MFQHKQTLCSGQGKILWLSRGGPEPSGAAATNSTDLVRVSPQVTAVINPPPDNGHHAFQHAEVLRGEDKGKDDQIQEKESKASHQHQSWLEEEIFIIEKSKKKKKKAREYTVPFKHRVKVRYKEA